MPILTQVRAAFFQVCSGRLASVSPRREWNGGRKGAQDHVRSALAAAAARRSFGGSRGSDDERGPAGLLRGLLLLHYRLMCDVWWMRVSWSLASGDAGLLLADLSAVPGSAADGLSRSAVSG